MRRVPLLLQLRASRAKGGEFGCGFAEKTHTSDEGEALRAVVAAWEALPGGRDYSIRIVQDWLVKDMKPAIDAARAALATPAQGERTT